jgi:hypothetical protein
LIIALLKGWKSSNILGTTLTNQHSIQEEIKNRLKKWNSCYYLVQNLLPSSLLSKNLKIKIYRNTILHAVVYGYETWSLTLKDERRLRVFENRVLRITFGSKRNEVTGEWRKLHNEKLNDLYSSPNIVRVIKSSIVRWAGHVARMKRVKVYTGIWWEKVRERDNLKDPCVEWEDNSKMDLQAMGCGSMDWIDLAQDRDRWRALVNSVMNLWVS